MCPAGVLRRLVRLLWAGARPSHPSGLSREQVLEQLRDVCVRIGVTEHGVGVVAIRDIPAGVDPFSHCSSNGYHHIRPEELEGHDPAVVRMVKDFCALRGGSYSVPTCGLDAIDKSFYLKHSRTPNLAASAGGACFLTSRPVRCGEELTVDYDTFDEEVEDFRL